MVVRLAKPWIGRDELRAVESVLESGQLVQGAKVAAFEQAVAQRVARTFGVAVTNGTAALVLALRALDVGPGDEVLCPALSWPSPAHAIQMMRATPVFVDVHPSEWNAAAESYAQARSVRTKAAIVIDQFGNPARAKDLEAALDGIAIVEDAACALGSRFAERPCGSLGAISCFSFHPRKIITTGEGGMCVTDDEALAQRLQVLRNHGQSSPGVFEAACGNYRMTEMAAALGLVQLDRLDAMIARRIEVMTSYRNALGGLALFQETPPGAQSNFQTAGLCLRNASAQARDVFLDKLRRRDIHAGRLSYAVDRLKSTPTSTPMNNAHQICDSGVALPLFPTMSDNEVQQVIDAVREELPHA